MAASAAAAAQGKLVAMPWSMTSRVQQQTAMTPSMYERAKCHCYGKPQLCNRLVQGHFQCINLVNLIQLRNYDSPFPNLRILPVS